MHKGYAHPNCPEDYLRYVSANAPVELSGWVVRNPNCPVDILSDCLKRSNSFMALEILKNPQCTESMLDLALASPEWEIRQAVVQHPSCTVRLLEKAADDTDSDVLTSIYIEILSVHLTSWRRVGVLRYPLLKKQYLQTLIALEVFWRKQFYQHLQI